MDVLLPSLDGQYRIVTGVRIRTPVTTLEEARAAALREVRAFTAQQAELLREISRPFDRAELPPDPAAAFAVTAVAMEARYPGPVFCPACCRKLGTGDSPAIGYLTKCPGCQRKLTVTAVDGAITITLRTE